ncbi:unnamed protein product [Ranitomeya imitator]|uniref:DnaJ-like protein n=1 Tax=Ranitomeya imitator TaxID=111125 RepID=A0ABN9M6E9_9NEOB|nr:unnamed protein product [Ranitomeya imitator]
MPVAESDVVRDVSLFEAVVKATVEKSRAVESLELGAGDLQGPLFGLKIFRNLTPKCFFTTSCVLQFSSQGVRPGLTTMVARHLDKNTMGYIQWRWGIQSAMNTSIVRDTKTSHFTMAFQLGIPHSFMMVSYQHKFEDEEQTRLKGSIKAGFFGTVVEYGAERKISRHSVLGATVSVGVPQGVSLKVKLNRASQTYFFPIHLTDQLLPSAVFYATVGPLIIYVAMHRLIIKPYLKAEKEKELEKQRESSASDILKKKQEAEAAVRLMQESVRRIIEAEESRMGLIILNAWYGKFVTDNSRRNERVKVIDVTVPLQCLVKDSKLILTEASKAGLPGFYDPCIGEDKSLKILYQFRGVMHQVMSGDNEALRIPKQCEFIGQFIEHCRKTITIKKEEKKVVENNIYYNNEHMQRKPHCFTGTTSLFGITWFYTLVQSAISANLLLSIYNS